MQCSALLNRLDRYTCSTPANSMRRVSVDAETNQAAGLSSIEATGRVSAWQRLRLGSGGGWAAVSPMKGRCTPGTGGRISETESGSTPGTVGRQFYTYTKDDALDIALKAADKVLCRIADEVDF